MLFPVTGCREDKEYSFPYQKVYWTLVSPSQGGDKNTHVHSTRDIPVFAKIKIMPRAKRQVWASPPSLPQHADNLATNMTTDHGLLCLVDAADAMRTRPETLFG